tara:strand:+ start:408 stop:2420 length:2013 start_codon:yes stop_codon:yes gene_type:complete
MDKLKMSSTDMLSENVEKIAALFPNCVTETAEGKAIDFDLLKQELNNEVIEGNKERYRLEWPGKREAIVTANLPTTKTLRPVREDSVDFDNTENLYIEGDNLEVLKLLQESYLGKVKMIYIDPPYNTGKDFVYKDNFSKATQEELIESGQKDEYNQRLVANPESAGRYHSDWLSMMYPRLKLARNLLKDDGVIFISIDDNEITNLKKVCDEIFGEHNFVGILSVENNPKGRKNSKFISISNDYCLIFAKKIESSLFVENIPKKSTDMTQDEDGNYVHNSGKRVLVGENSFNKNVINFSSEKHYSVYHNKSVKNIKIISEKAIDEIDSVLIKEGYNRYISSREGKFIENTYSKSKFKDLFDDSALEFKSGKIFGKNFSSKIRIKSIITNNNYDALIDNKITKYKIDVKTTSAGTALKKLFNTNEVLFEAPKNVGLIKLLITLFEDKDLLLLDFFSGSGTSAHSILEQNNNDNGTRKFIHVQLPEETDKKSDAFNAGYEKICEIGKERIRRAGNKILEESRTKEGELEFDSKNDNKLDVGFRVYRLDESNMQDVYYKPQDYNQGQLDLVADNVKSDRTADDLLAQVMLDWGLPLSLKIDQGDVLGKKLFKVAENSLFACFDTGIDEEFAKEIAKESPLRIVFKDGAFKDDTAKVNVKQLLKQLSPETEMKVI